MWATPKTSSPSRTWGPSWTWTSSVFSFFPFLGAILVENYLDKTFRLRKIFKKGSGPVDGNKTLNEMSGKKPYIFWKCHLFIVTFSFWLYNAFLRNDISKKSRNLHIMPVYCFSIPDFMKNPLHPTLQNITSVPKYVSFYISIIFF